VSPVLDDRHDFAHPVEGDTAWSESYYFNCYCPDTDAGFFTRMGIRPNEGTIDVGLSIWLPGGGLAALRHVREQTVMIDDDLAVGPVRYERLAPMKSWRLVASGESTLGPVSMDVTFDALTPPIGADGQGTEGASSSSAATRQVVGKGHLEQAGRWSGWIEGPSGQRSVLGPDARGNRDKSWGPRRWGGPKMWRWFSINIGDDVHFGGIRIGTDAGDLHRGWVWKDGSATSVASWDVRTSLADDGVTHRVTDLTVTDKRGRTHELRADLLRVDPGPAGIRPNATIVNEGLARWSYEGRTGYGISEYLHQLGPDSRPVVPID
jgi:hypothetical protein